MGKIESLKGKRFRNFIVIQRTEPFKLKSGQHARWICKCDSGHEFEASSNHIKTTLKKCPKCPNIREDLSGKRFGMLVVVEYFKSDSRDNYWKCLCDCGNINYVKTASLNGGVTKSCGCLQKTHAKLEEGEAAKNAVILSYSSAAKARNLEWLLSREEALVFLTKPCQLCGIASSNLKNTVNGTFKYNGIDRVDNTKGYTLDNIQTLCRHCNYSKKDLSMEDFNIWIDRLIDYQTSKKSKIKSFYLFRKSDVSGISGTGVIATGVILESNRCLLEWRGEDKTATIFDNLEQIRKIHGHESSTEIIMGDPPDEAPVTKVEKKKTIKKRSSVK